MRFDEAVAYLLSLGHETLTIKLGLESTETLLRALGNPERAFPSVQIAGTNGKGSTSAFLDSICRVAGIRTGLFTSPHLISITERIKIGGDPIRETDFAELTNKVKAAAEQLVARGELPALPTFFEQVTAIALLAFAEARVDLAILETGLGGRLDSTTAARAGIVGITAIDMDHQEYLGDTLAEIAGEKAAIIQPGVAAVVAPQKEEALEVILTRAQTVGVLPRLMGAHTSVDLLTTTRDGRAVVAFKTSQATYDRVTLALRGLHQIENAATAIGLAETLSKRNFEINNEAIVQGLENANHPGRLEILPGAPPFLFDGAHNAAAAIALGDYLGAFVNEPVVMIFGAMRDKPLSEMMSILFPRVASVILTTLDNPRAASVDELAAAVPTALVKDVVRTSSVAEALAMAARITPPDGTVCVTGSLHLIGAVQELLRANT